MQNNWESTTATADSHAIALAQGKQAQLLQLTGSNVGALYNLVGTLVIGRASDADLRIDGVGISRHHARVNQYDYAIEFEDLGSTNGSFVNGERIARRELRPGDKIQLGSGTILRFGYQDELDADFQRLMFESASRDMVTELCNERFFRERLDAEFAFATRHQTPLSLISFAIDDFRSLEESHGALAENRVLSTLAKAVLSIIRSEDLIAHCGHGTFAILSREIDAACARAIAERVRELVENLGCELDGHVIDLTICVGLAAMPHDLVATPHDLLERAERALMQARLKGRNSVATAD